MKSSFVWSATLAIVVAALSTAAYGQGVPGTSGPSPYGGPVRGMPGYDGGMPMMPAGMYGGGPGMPPPGMGGMPAYSSPGRITGQGLPPGMMAPGMFGPGMAGPMGPAPGMPGMQVAAQGEVDLGPPPELPEGATPWNNPLAAEETACYSGTCGCCTNCCSPGLMWAELDFMLWWQKGSRLPPLVTSNNIPNVPRPEAGVIGAPSTIVLFGDEQAGDGMNTGGRAELGFWFDQSKTAGIGNRFTALSGDRQTFYAESDSSTVLARPFYDQLLMQENAYLIAFNDPVDGPITNGRVYAQFENEFVMNELYLRTMLERDRNKRLDLVLGYHFLRLDNYLRVNSFNTATDVVLNGTTFSIFDRFDTENEFHGGTIGLDGSYRRGRWSLDYLAKVSFGQMRQTAEIDGGRAINPFGLGPSVNTAGGVLAEPTNMGVHTRYEEVFIPEFSLGLTYYARPNLSFGMSYNYMWISSVLLSGDQIDRHVDPSLFNGGAPVVNPPRPEFRFNDTSYWLMGMNFSVQYNY